MKITDLRKKIIIKFVLTAVLSAILVAGAFLGMSQEDILRDEIKKIDSEKFDILREIKELEKKAIEIKKYLAVWREMDDTQKAAEGIVMDKMNNIVGNIAKNHNISGHSLSVNVPQKLEKGIFNTKAIDVVHAKAVLRFTSVSDYEAIMFAKDLTKKLPGYINVTSFSVNKTGDYKDEDLVNISLGKHLGLVESVLEFSWYNFRNTLQTKDNIQQKKKLIQF